MASPTALAQYAIKHIKSGRVIGSTVLLGLVTSDIDTINHVRRNRQSTDAASDEPRITTVIIFPVVATR